MYIPKHFSENDPARIRALLQRYSFATVITHDGKEPIATHMPVLYRPASGLHGTLVSHMARANPQWRYFANGGETLVVFHGPHAYISPSWYQTQPAVPTWDYAAVHVYGVPVLIEDAAQLRAMLRELVAAFESHRATPYGELLNDTYLDNLLPAIVGFEIPVKRIEGKFKLSQNRPASDLPGVIRELERSPDQSDREVAELMRPILSQP